ncbi:Fic family protein [Dyadobacter sp. 3J3]|uniref:Fic family protein n=1 Tax=Dyadobacter sp. 3J3 TaxID=2606600 RepID=UPI00135BBB55|nr:Fic family protein [Dyadobacter sp. 3J3]
MKKPEPTPVSVIDFDKDAKEIVTLMTDVAVQASLNLIEKDYPYWETFKYKVKGDSKLKDVNPVSLWKIVKLRRSQSSSRVVISSVTGFEFSYTSTERSLRLLHEFDMNLGGNMQGVGIIPQENKNRYLISSIMEEAIASSLLEGAATTREKAKQMLRSQREPRNEAEKMVLNNYLTIRRVLELKNEELSVDLIRDIHATVTKGTLKNEANEGNFRSNNEVQIVDSITGEVFYTPPDFELLEKLMEAVCNFANEDNESEFIHPIIRGIILHFLIGYIHPFVDGNGRTARALFYWFLLSRKYWLIEYLSISRILLQAPSQYAKAYLHSEFDNNDLTYFIDFNLKTLKQSLTELQAYINWTVEDRRKVFSLIVNQDFNERQIDIIKDFLRDKDQTISIKEIESKFGIANQTARTDLLDLVDKGYIKVRTMGRKMIFFPIEDLEDKLKK